MVTVNTLPKKLFSFFSMFLSSRLSPMRRGSSVSCYVGSVLRGNGSIARELFWNQILSVTPWRHPLGRTAGTNVCGVKKEKKGWLGKREEADNSPHTCSLKHWGQSSVFLFPRRWREFKSQRVCVCVCACVSGSEPRTFCMTSEQEKCHKATELQTNHPDSHLLHVLGLSLMTWNTK